jgi:hypothetical protein
MIEARGDLSGRHSGSIPLKDTSDDRCFRRIDLSLAGRN